MAKSLAQNSIRTNYTLLSVLVSTAVNPTKDTPLALTWHTVTVTAGALTVEARNQSALNPESQSNEHSK